MTRREQAIAAHRAFQKQFQLGRCSYCGGELTSFDNNRPCRHWLLVPLGFTKRHFMELARCYGLFQMQWYLRWVANEDVFAQNINDLSDEGAGKLIEITIRSKDFEWAFSCGEGDYHGHLGAAGDAACPHYHFQMRRKKHAFIRYNDFHIPLSPFDMRAIEDIRANPNFLRGRFVGGEGMADLFNDNTLDLLIEMGQPTTNEQQATFHLSTIVEAEDGKTISGNDIADIIAEAKAKGVTVASLLPKLKNAKKTTIVVEPAPGVVEQAPRSGRGRGTAG